MFAVENFCGFYSFLSLLINSFFICFFFFFLKPVSAWYCLTKFLVAFSGVVWHQYQLKTLYVTNNLNPCWRIFCNDALLIIVGFPGSVASPVACVCRRRKKMQNRYTKIYCRWLLKLKYISRRSITLFFVLFRPSIPK